MIIKWTGEKKMIALYALKCVAGCVIVFLLSELFNYPDISWFLISTMLVLSPDSGEAVKLALTRIYANLVAGVSSILCLLIHPVSVITISISIILTIVLCYLLKVMSGARSAVAAVIIIMLHGLTNVNAHLWDTTLQRILSVLAGCLLGLLITLVFHRKLQADKKNGEVKNEEA